MKAIIIDDEVHCTESLSILLEKYSDVKVTRVFYNPLDALKVIEQLDFDILFIDIEMPELNGLEFVNAIDCNSCHIVFTTAYDEYAIRAFKLNAFDYLLKPIGKTDLLATLGRLKKVSTSIKVNNQHPLVSRIQKIAIPCMSGFEMLMMKDILYIEADGNYVRIFTKNRKTILCAKSLKEIEIQLRALPFVRIHHSYIVYLDAISKYVKGDGGYVVLENGTLLNVSRSRKEDLICRLR